MRENKHKYSASFTSGGLLLTEFEALLPVLLGSNVDTELKDEVAENRLLQLNAESTRKRIIGEIRKRATNFDNDFLSFFSAAGNDERKLLLFYIVLKTYKLVFDFHFDVTIPNWKRGNISIDPYNYQMKLDELSAANTEVDAWSELTKKKVVSVYIVMLNQSGLSKDKNLTKVIIEDNFWCYFIGRGDSWFLDACLLSSDTRDRINTLCR